MVFFSSETIIVPTIFREGDEKPLLAMGPEFVTAPFGPARATFPKCKIGVPQDYTTRRDRRSSARVASKEKLKVQNLLLLYYKIYPSMSSPPIQLLTKNIHV
eukprot:2650269-Pyramimonas_sp.AAC.1